MRTVLREIFPLPEAQNGPEWRYSTKVQGRSQRIILIMRAPALRGIVGISMGRTMGASSFTALHRIDLSLVYARIIIRTRYSLCSGWLAPAPRVRVAARPAGRSQSPDRAVPAAAAGCRQYKEGVHILRVDRRGGILRCATASFDGASLMLSDRGPARHACKSEPRSRRPPPRRSWRPASPCSERRHSR